MKARAHYARKRPPPVLVLAILSSSDMSRVTEIGWIAGAMLLAVAAVFMIWFWVHPQPAQDRELVAHSV